MPRSTSPFARSHPAAVALLVFLAALSARGTRPGSAPEDGAHAWPAAAEVAEVAGGVGEASGAGTAPMQATLVRTAAGEIGELRAEPGAAIEPEVSVGVPEADVPYPHPVEYLTVMVAGAPTPLAFMDVSPSGPVNGRIVLLLHDRDEAGDAWAPTIAALSADGFRVLVPDQVGHGRSGRPGAELSPATLAAQAAVLLDSLGAPRVAVVGDGLGAAVALRLAGTHAGMVDRLVLRASGGVPEVAPGGGFDGPLSTATRPTMGGSAAAAGVPALVVRGGEELGLRLLLDFLGS